MKDKSNSSTNDTSDHKNFQHPKNVLSKYDYELFREEDDVVEATFRVKRVSLPNKGERWRIFQDAKIIFTVEGSRVSKKEKEYLRTPDGFNFLISQAKIGIKSLAKLRSELKLML